MKKWNSWYGWILILLVFSFTTGCVTSNKVSPNASPIVVNDQPQGLSQSEETLYKSLSTTADVVDSMMKMAGSAYKAGIIQDDTKHQIISLHDKYRVAYLAAVNAFITYKKTKDSALGSKLIGLVSDLTSTSTEFMGFIQPIIAKVQSASLIQ